MTEPSAEVRLLTELEVSERLRVRPQTVRRWRWAGTGPSWVKLGRVVRYRGSAVEDWLRAKERG